jgi:hypothetical protein
MAIMAAALASNTATKVVAQDTEAMVATGLGYAPQQQNVQYDQVDAKDASKCTGKYETLSGIDGLMIYGPDGRLLRRFADTNGDKVISNWEFFLALDPNNIDGNDYVFDNFDWEHCE